MILKSFDLPGTKLGSHCHIQTKEECNEHPNLGCARNGNRHQCHRNKPLFPGLHDPCSECTDHVASETKECRNDRIAMQPDLMEDRINKNSQSWQVSRILKKAQYQIESDEYHQNRKWYTNSHRQKPHRLE